MNSASNKQQASGRSALFLDRDGVINRRLIKRYVKSWDEFEFLPGFLDAIPVLNRHFDRSFVVTNQRGIGLGLMTIDDLEQIHQKLLLEVKNSGGHIDKIYYCDKKHDARPNCRKPDPHMALKAQKDFPEIDFSRSVMVGDQPSDIEFGKNLGMKTVWIPNEPGMVWENDEFRPDLSFDSLLQMANFFW